MCNLFLSVSTEVFIVYYFYIINLFYSRYIFIILSTFVFSLTDRNIITYMHLLQNYITAIYTQRFNTHLIYFLMI